MVHRHQPLGLLFKPRVSLLFAATGTVPVAAGTSHPVLATAALTLVFDAAKLAGSAAHDRAEHFAVADRNAVAELLQVCRCVLPQGIRNGGHALTSTEQLFDRLAGIGLGGFGQVQVDHRRL